MPASHRVRLRLTARTLGSQATAMRETHLATAARSTRDAKLLRGTETHAAAELLKFADGMTPLGQSNYRHIKGLTEHEPINAAEYRPLSR
jgi:hypothetical protein